LNELEVISLRDARQQVFLQPQRMIVQRLHWSPRVFV